MMVEMFEYSSNQVPFAKGVTDCLDRKCECARSVQCFEWKVRMVSKRVVSQLGDLG
jgi:hypothetical protein